MARSFAELGSDVQNSRLAIAFPIIAAIWREAGAIFSRLALADDAVRRLITQVTNCPVGAS
jgi:hypothetical protein